MSTIAPSAQAAGGLPPVGVPYSQLLSSAPQLAPADPGGATSASASVWERATQAIDTPLGQSSGVFARSAIEPVVYSAPVDAGSIVQVRPGQQVVALSSPGGSAVETFDSRSDTGDQPRAFAVYRIAAGGWLGVSVPARRHGLAWLKADGNELLARPATEAIRVSLRRRDLELLSDGRVVLRTLVVIGGTSSPTPVGQFAVADKLRYIPASPAYGIGALALSVAPSGLNWAEWRVAIHGLDNLGQVGGTGSEGCVHVPTPALRRLLSSVPVGTPVDIVS